MGQASVGAAWYFSDGWSPQGPGSKASGRLELLLEKLERTYEEEMLGQGRCGKQVSSSNTLHLLSNAWVVSQVSQAFVLGDLSQPGGPGLWQAGAHPRGLSACVCH